MAITIGGINISSVNLNKNKETGLLDLTGSYLLESSTGIVLARQDFNGYNTIKLEPSPKTKGLLNDFHKSLQEDLTTILGLN